nr:hypothetical protein [Streptomyces vietnamensis]
MSSDLLLDEQGGGDVSVLLLQPMFQGDKECRAVLVMRLGTHLPSDSYEARPPALGGESQGLAWPLTCTGLKVDGKAKLWRDVRSDQIHLGWCRHCVLVHRHSIPTGYPDASGKVLRDSLVDDGRLHEGGHHDHPAIDRGDRQPLTGGMQVLGELLEVASRQPGQRLPSQARPEMVTDEPFVVAARGLAYDLSLQPLLSPGSQRHKPLPGIKANAGLLVVLTLSAKASAPSAPTRRGNDLSR